MIERWRMLSDREREIVIRCIVEQDKLEAVAEHFGVSRTSIVLAIQGIYRVLGVRNQLDLALELGKNWDEIERMKKEGATR